MSGKRAERKRGCARDVERCSESTSGESDIDDTKNGESGRVEEIQMKMITMRR